jgi:Arc/MetJ-type ribon-helix-helix transcriptional regulator
MADCAEPAMWYDSGMTAMKIAITLPEQQLVRVRRAVRAGRADSVSGYISRVLAEQEREESLSEIVRDLIAEHGEPSREDKAWARRVLSRRRG